MFFVIFCSVNDHGFPKFSIPNSNAFLDFDGDCHPDLFFTEKVGNDTKFTIWIWNPANAKFERNKTYGVPRGAGQVSFSDFSKKPINRKQRHYLPPSLNSLTLLPLPNRP